VWKKIPSCPEGNWLLGQTMSLARTSTPWHRLADWLDAHKGPIVRFRILGRLAVIVDDPYAIKRIFQTHVKLYPKDTAFAYGTFLSILGTGLVTSDGTVWQEQRLLMAPVLRIDLLETVIPIAKRALSRLTVKLEEIRGSGRPIDLANELRHLTLQVIGEAIMSLQPQECDEVLAKIYLPIMEECNKRVIHRWRVYVPTLSWFQQEQRLRKLNNFIKTVVEKRWRDYTSETQPRDLLDQMIAALKKKGKEWSADLFEQMCYELKTFLLAGHETSASMLAWSLYELLRKPEYLAKVRKEADRVFANEDTTPGQKELDTMQYTLAVLKESLRKYSIVPVVSRELSADQDELSGYSIPKGTMVIISIRGVHAKYKNPTDFDPGRFLPGGEYDAFDDDIRPFMFLPFIQGPRNCLGQYFAMMEARYVLSFLLKNFEFTLADPHPIVPGDVIPEAPSHGLNVLVT